MLSLQPPFLLLSLPKATIVSFPFLSLTRRGSVTVLLQCWKPGWGGIQFHVFSLWVCFCLVFSLFRSPHSFFFLIIYLFIFGCVGLLLLFPSCGGQGLLLLWCMDFSFQWLLLLRSTCGLQQLQLPGSKSTGSIVVSRGLRCSSVCGMLLDQGSNPCLLH